MMRTGLIIFLINLILKIVSSLHYNQRCTFSFNTCDWNIGRRWQVKNLVDEIDDKVLIAVDRSNQDKELGFTDVITSSWLYLTSSCSFNIRLTFQFNIENEQDQLEVFLIKKDRTQTSSIGRWKAKTNAKKSSPEDSESFWQQAKLTFKAADEFRIEIEFRHLPDRRNNSTTWFAIDDILIESCPNLRMTTTTSHTQPALPSTTRSHRNLSHSSSFNRSFLHFRWKFNDSFNSFPDESTSPRLTFLTFILYLLCSLLALTLLIIFLAIIIFGYRKHCFPPTAPIINSRHHSSRRKRHNSHIDQDARTEKTMVTTVRTCY